MNYPQHRRVTDDDVLFLRCQQKAELHVPRAQLHVCTAVRLTAGWWAYMVLVFNTKNAIIAIKTYFFLKSMPSNVRSFFC